MSNLKISVVTDYVGKGITQANKEVKGMEKNVKSLGYLLGGGYLGAKVIAFGKASVKAFAEDDRAAQVLTRSLTNLGLAFQDVNVQQFIQDLEKSTGVLDDKLRPAFQKLLTTTGSVAESQKILRTALDLSAASGVDLETVAADLSKAYSGQTRGLAKYGLGLTKAELAGMKFAEIQDKINKLFAGQAAVVANTYAGKIDKITVAAENAKEAIGKGLVDALTNLGGGGSDGLDTVISKFETLTGWVAKFTAGLGGQIGAIGKALTGDFKGAAALLSSSSSSPSYKGAIPSIQAELSTKAAEDYLKKLREQYKVDTKITAEKKKQLALEKAKANLAKAQANFDITKINLAAALKGKVTEEERLRLLALQAIENENGDLALSWIAKLDAARKKAADDEATRQEALVASIQARMNVILALQDRVNAKIAGNQAADQAAAIATMADVQTRISTIAAAQTRVDEKIAGNQIADIQARMDAIAALQARVNAKAGVTINVNAGAVANMDQVTDAVSLGLQNSSLSGSFAQINRNVSIYE
jgi:uncharacterized protein YgfB (UPF0149 family)